MNERYIDDDHYERSAVYGITFTFDRTDALGRVMPDRVTTLPIHCRDLDIWTKYCDEWIAVPSSKLRSFRIYACLPVTWQQRSVYEGHRLPRRLMILHEWPRHHSYSRVA